jgi:hypothetical protein
MKQPNELTKLLAESGERPMVDVMAEAVERGLVFCNREFIKALGARTLTFQDVVFDFAARPKPKGVKVMPAPQVLQ